MTSPRDRKRAFAIAAVLFILVFAIYGQVATHRFLQLDDSDYVVQNAHVNTGLSLVNVRWALTAFYSSNWHPLTWISHMTDVELFGLDAGRMLLVNAAFHACNALLLFLFFRRTTQRLWPSAVVAALFAVHPLHVESVAWVSERKDVLSTFFFLVTLLAYAGWVKRRSAWLYGATVAALALGLMAKPMLVTTPFVLLLVDWWPLRRPLGARLLVEKIPHFVLVVASVLITLRAQTEAIASVPFPARLANAALSYVQYLGKTFWPFHLAAIYSYRTVIPLSLVSPAVVVLLAITIAALILARRFPYLLTGWLWYAGTLVPVIGVIQVGRQAMADRYTYIPLIGVFFALVWLAADLVASRRVLAVSAGACIAVLSMLAWIQTGYWRDGTTLFEHAIAVTVKNPYAHGLLAIERLAARDFEGAATEFRIALRSVPHDDLDHSGLGGALIELGRIDEGRRELLTAISINPSNAYALRTLGLLAVREGRKDEGIAYYERSLRSKNDPQTVAALAAAKGDLDSAIGGDRAALETAPDNPELHNDLAAALALKGDDAEALAEYRAALRLAPDHYDANLNIGALLSRLERNEEAAEHFSRAATARPGSPEPHVYLALIRAQEGRLSDAAGEGEAALAIDPAVANREFTSATHMPEKDSNLAGWVAFLRTKASGS